MDSSWGRFTICGSDELEQRMSALMDGVREAAQPILPPDVCRAMVLFGGYGRGEGGVESIDGVERPHNNLDFLVITEPGCRRNPNHLKSQLSEALQPLREQYRIEMDLAVIGAAKLCGQPALVMWYDMRLGHKCVLGDADFLPSLVQFNVDNIPPWDVWRLMVNRGTLLVINDYLLARRPSQFDPRRTVIRHGIKAIIGYGDALLFFLGGYHWSYQEKQSRMREIPGVPDELRRIYDDAIQFRFRPQYERYIERDLAAWMNELRTVFHPIHLRCETIRLGRDTMTWDDYAEAALSRALAEDVWSAREWAKKARNFVCRPAWWRGGSWRAGLGLGILGPQGRLGMAYPGVAFYDQAVPCRKLARAVLDAPADDVDEFRRLYIKLWSEHGDINFRKFLETARLSLEPQRNTP